MKIKFTLTDGDLVLLPSATGVCRTNFDEAIKAQVGSNLLVSSGYMLLEYDFPNSHILQSMFHPTYFKDPPRQKQYEYEMIGSSISPGMKLVFTEKDFTAYREFGKAVCRQTDNTATYISSFGRAYISFFFDFPEALNELRRPSVIRMLDHSASMPDKQYPFELESSVPKQPTK